MENNIKQKAYALKEELIETRRKIHKNPELGFDVYKTTNLVKDELRKSEVKIIPLDSDAGVLGILKGKKTGRESVVALRADMDAVPIQEKSGLPYASQNNGVMHACGHDGHTAVLLGVAKLLSEVKDKFSGTVKFIFQPAEEILSGAKTMVAEGVLKNPDVEEILALHSWPDLEVGEIGVYSGVYMASSDKFEVRIIGSGGHGCYPHKTIDPIIASSNAIALLQNIVSRKMDPTGNAVLSVCTLNSDKGAFNVIPNEVQFSGTVRYHDKKLGDKIKQEMENTLKGVASSFGCKFELNYEKQVPPVINDSSVVKSITKAAAQTLGKENIKNLTSQSMGAEDFSIYLREVSKGVLFRLGITDPGERPLIIHSDNYNFNDEAIPVGVSVLAQYILNKG